MKTIVLLFSILMISGVCSAKSDFKPNKKLVSQLSEQLNYLVTHTKDDKLVPRSFVAGKYNMVKPSDWTSGFVAVDYWFMYELTGDEKWKKTAIENTIKLDGIQFI